MREEEEGTTRSTVYILAPAYGYVGHTEFHVHTTYYLA